MFGRAMRRFHRQGLGGFPRLRRTLSGTAVAALVGTLVWVPTSTVNAAGSSVSINCNGSGNTLDATSGVLSGVITFAPVGGCAGGVLTLTSGLSGSWDGSASTFDVTISPTANATQTVVITKSGRTATINLTVTNAPSKLAVSQQPVGGQSGATLATQPWVAIQQSDGSATSSTATVSVAISSGAGGDLGGTTSVAAVAGTAKFTDLTLSGIVGTSYVLQFTSSDLTSTTSSNVTITAGTATKLGMKTQPSSSTSGVSISPAPAVYVQDAKGNTVTGDSSTIVTAALTSGSGTLSGTTTATAVNGVATFTNLIVTGSGAHTLSFTSGALTSVNSTSFTVASTASKLGIATEPSGATDGVAFTQQPVVHIQDSGGNTVSSSPASVTVAIGSGGGTLNGTKTVSASNGVATFSGLSVTGTGSHTLTFTSTGLTSTTSASFTVSAAGGGGEGGGGASSTATASATPTPSATPTSTPLSLIHI